MSLLFKEIEKRAGRDAGLDLDGEWMFQGIVVCLFLIQFQGIVYDFLEVHRVRVIRDSENLFVIERQILGVKSQSVTDMGDLSLI